MREIVVGVDGTEPSHRALAWALQEARRVDAVLLVVHAYRPAPRSNAHSYSYSFLPATAVRMHGEHERERADVSDQVARLRAEALVDRALQQVGAEGDTGPVVKRLTLARDPAKALIDLSRSGDLLVVGSRGRSGLGGVRASSVSQRCLAQAHSPVVVVR